jgi:hypothetical protein
MTCEYCGHTLIHAISIQNDEPLVLVESPPFYGPTYGSQREETRNGIAYELVRPLPRSLILHSAVCQSDLFS